MTDIDLKTWATDLPDKLRIVAKGVDARGMGKLADLLREEASIGDQVIKPSMSKRKSSPEMPEGFTDRTAWEAIHHRIMPGSTISQMVIDWQRDNQDRVRAALAAEREYFRRLNPFPDECDLCGESPNDCGCL